MSRLRDERGILLIDLVISMGLMIVILGATLTAFNGFEGTSRANQLQNDAQDRVRVAMDRLARDLRNDWIKKATASDVVAQSVDGAQTPSQNVRRRVRVRYCLAGSNLWREVQTWTEPPTPTMWPTTSCGPGDGWSNQAVVADDITNTANGQQRPVFLFDRPDAAIHPNDVAEIRGQLFVDVEPTRAPGESKLLSGVYLRNRNRAPTAAFTAAGEKPGYLLLNGTLSSDPDSDVLAYAQTPDCPASCWRDGGSPIAPNLLAGSGPVVEYGPLPSGSQHTISLTVGDPAGLQDTTGSQTVTVP